MSKFEKEVLKRLSEEGDKSLAKRSYEKAKGKIELQIASLKYELTEKNYMLSVENEKLNSAKFNINFDIEAYDSVYEKVSELEEKIADIEHTIEVRKKLLEDWE